MISSTQSNPCIRSGLNVNPSKPSNIKSVKKANCGGIDEKEKLPARRQLPTSTLGQIAWNQLMVERGVINTTQSFMKELKEAIPVEEFEAVTKEIEKTVMGEIEDHPNNKYLSLNEARNDIYNIYIEALKEEAGLIITNNIESLEYKKGQVKTKISEIEYNTN